MSAHGIPHQQPSDGSAVYVHGVGSVEFRRGSLGQLIALVRGLDGRLEAITAEMHPSGDEPLGLVAAIDRRIRSLSELARAIHAMDPAHLPPAGTGAGARP